MIISDAAPTALIPLDRKIFEEQNFSSASPKHYFKMNVKYESPLLTRVLYTFGALTIIAAVIGGAMICANDSMSEGIAIICGGIFAGIIYIGIGQAVSYLARTAFATDNLNTALETLVMKRLEAIEERLSPATPLLVRVDSTPPPPSAQNAYFYSDAGTKTGPFSSSEMRQFWAGGVIRDDTSVLRDGDPQWRTYGELLGLKKK
jgi:hypothetical protein